MEKELIKKLAIELAKRDKEDLVNVVSTMKFEEAFKVLNGFNLTIDACVCQGDFLGNNVFFDVNYKSISTTIFMTTYGNCEVYDNVSVWLDDFSSPILENVTI